MAEASPFTAKDLLLSLLSRFNKIQYCFLNLEVLEKVEIIWLTNVLFPQFLFPSNIRWPFCKLLEIIASLKIVSHRFCAGADFLLLFADDIMISDFSIGITANVKNDLLNILIQNK